MGERHGVCVECGEYFMNGEEPYICNSCINGEEMRLGNIIKVHITDEMRENAHSRSLEYKNKLSKSILKGEGTYLGCIGEEIVKKYMKDITYVGSYNFDFIYKKKRIEIKTKKRSVKPKPHYDCSINAETFSQNPDYYIFVSVVDGFRDGYILGICSKEYFSKVSRFIEKGQQDTNGFVARTNMKNIMISQLGDLDEFIKRNNE